MVKHTLKIFWCEHYTICKVCLAIIHHNALKGETCFIDFLEAAVQGCS